MRRQASWSWILSRNAANESRSARFKSQRTERSSCRANSSSLPPNDEDAAHATVANPTNANKTRPPLGKRIQHLIVHRQRNRAPENDCTKRWSKVRMHRTRVRKTPAEACKQGSQTGRRKGRKLLDRAGAEKFRACPSTKTYSVFL